MQEAQDKFDKMQSLIEPRLGLELGTPTMVSDLMEEWFTTGAADGFNIQAPCIPVDAVDFVELAIPELQRRGLFRSEYEGSTLREHLGLRPVLQRAGFGADRLAATL